MKPISLFVASAICLATSMGTAMALSIKTHSMTDHLPDSLLITGELVDGNSKQILVCRAHEHPLSHQIIVPVIDGKFRIALPPGRLEAYVLIPEENFETFLRPYLVFPEKNVHVKLYPAERYQDNTAFGSPLTEAYHNMRTDLRQRAEEAEAETDSLNVLAAGGKLPEDVVRTKDSLLHIDIIDWYDDYISKHPDLVSYQVLKELTLAFDDEYAKELVKKHYPAFATLFPGHPYTEMIGAHLNGEYQRTRGKQYISFKAEDLAGNLVLADTLLSPKATLLNFWASWCGPCIRKTRTMVPVYEAFSDKGFTIINIARELRDTESINAVLEREKLPWQTNLVDLESQYGVWHKYGITNLGGAMVLVDGSKRILAVDPTPEEVKDLLEQLDE